LQVRCNQTLTKPPLLDSIGWSPPNLSVFSEQVCSTGILSTKPFLQYFVNIYCPITLRIGTLALHKLKFDYASKNWELN